MGTLLLTAASLDIMASMVLRPLSWNIQLLPAAVTTRLRRESDRGLEGLFTYTRKFRRWTPIPHKRAAAPHL
jgi:hypothetical protein